MDTAQNPVTSGIGTKPALARLRAWVEHTYPEEYHANATDIGYYAAPDYEKYDELTTTAKLLYYGGPGSRHTVSEMLAQAARALDQFGITYTWRENSWKYAYLIVDVSKLPHA